MSQDLPTESGYYWMRYIHPDNTPSIWEIVKIYKRAWAHNGLTMLVQYLGTQPPTPLQHFSESNYEWIPIEFPGDKRLLKAKAVKIKS